MSVLSEPAFGSRRFNLHLPRTWWGRTLLAAPLVVFLLVGATVLLIASRTHVVLPDALPQAQTSVVLAADGSPMGTMQGLNRTIIPITQVPLNVRAAVVAAEDRKFYHEPALSLTGIFRAAFSDITHARIQAGGSTITQQYVKIAYLNSQRTFSRKLQEAIVAVKINRNFSKDEILGFYLNTIYFGRSTYGIQAAAQTYFGVNADALTVPQGAVLAALIQSPQRLDPAVNLQAAQIRWHYVIDGMVKDGALNAADAATLTYPAFRPISALNAAGPGAPSGVNGYIVDMADKELTARHFTSAQIHGGGLKIHTTIVPNAQRAAQTAVESLLKSPADPQAALVAVQPGTGRVEAVYGGRDFAKRQLNYATQAYRQPGSSFKPYVLYAALADPNQDISLKSTFDGRSPQFFPIGDGTTFEVPNFDHEQWPNVDLLTATAESVNTVFVPLAQKVGIQNVVDVAHKAGIPATVPGNGLQQKPDVFDSSPSIALGTETVSPIDQASAFSTFAAGGEAATPFIVDSVDDSHGKQIYKATPNAHQALDPAVVSDVTFALQGVLTHGTAQGKGLAGGRPAAGKTGTTDDSKDAWFVGYTPGLSTAVWMGYDTPRTLSNIEGQAKPQAGGNLPAQIWQQFMNTALFGTPIQPFLPPAMVNAPVITVQRPAPAPTNSTVPQPTTTSLPATGETTTTSGETTTTTRRRGDTTSTTSPETTTTRPPSFFGGIGAPAPTVPPGG
jgi:membrane peptidoglycan carboxypeptidase